MRDSLRQQEFQVHKEAKNKILGLAAVNKIRIHQRSRLAWIRVGDMNTKLFHLRANARWRRNHIPTLIHGYTTCITHDAKAAAIVDYFTKQLGSNPNRQRTLNWEVI
jgi:choline dehydrogenase-like flavoprotein